MAAPLEVWLTAGSTYTCLTVHRLAGAAVQAGVTFRLRPFNLGVLFNEAGHWPFPKDSPKTAYMWRDIGRRAAALGLSPRLPAPYPAPDVPLANRIAGVMIEDGRGLEWLQASYRAWFEQGYPPGSPEGTARSLRAIGAACDEVLARAERPEAHVTLDAATDEARRRGIFGAPSFMVGTELFWGDDRLADALAWASRD